MAAAGFFFLTGLAVAVSVSFAGVWDVAIALTRRLNICKDRVRASGPGRGCLPPSSGARAQGHAKVAALPQFGGAACTELAQPLFPQHWDNVDRHGYR